MYCANYFNDPTRSIQLPMTNSDSFLMPLIGPLFQLVFYSLVASDAENRKQGARLL
uniref:Uncharacterized protein n=1 Tax=Parascaris equorum TaxID=6256 RepID=A0A914RUD1_PAREQ